MFVEIRYDQIILILEFEAFMFKITMLPFDKVGSKLRGERLNQVSFPIIKIMSILATKKKYVRGRG